MANEHDVDSAICDLLSELSIQVTEIQGVLTAPIRDGKETYSRYELWDLIAAQQKDHAQALQHNTDQLDEIHAGLQAILGAVSAQHVDVQTRIAQLEVKLGTIEVAAWLGVGAGILGLILGIWAAAREDRGQVTASGSVSPEVFGELADVNKRLDSIDERLWAGFSVLQEQRQAALAASQARQQVMVAAAPAPAYYPRPQWTGQPVRTVQYAPVSHDWTHEIPPPDVH